MRRLWWYVKEMTGIDALWWRCPGHEWEVLIYCGGHEVERCAVCGKRRMPERVGR